MDLQDKVYLWLVAASLGALVTAAALNLLATLEYGGYSAAGAF